LLAGALQKVIDRLLVALQDVFPLPQALVSCGREDVGTPPWSAVAGLPSRLDQPVVLQAAQQTVQVATVGWGSDPPGGEAFEQAIPMRRDAAFAEQQQHAGLKEAVQ
jgi:hypothetical protein